MARKWGEYAIRSRSISSSSCTPTMTEAVAKAIPGARFTIMAGMGHFPMVENYTELRRYLLPELERMLA